LGRERNLGYENSWDVNGGKIHRNCRSYAGILLHLGNVFSCKGSVVVSLGFCILLSHVGIIGMGREGPWLNETYMLLFFENISGKVKVAVITIDVIHSMSWNEAGRLGLCGCRGP